MGCGVSKKRFEATILADKTDMKNKVDTEEVVIRVEAELEARTKELRRLQVSFSRFFILRCGCVVVHASHDRVASPACLPE